MRKGIKILGKVVAVALATAVILPLLLALTLQIPAVQNFVVQRVVRAVSDKLETTVSVERISIAFPGKVRVDGFYVEDYQQDTLLYAGRVEAFVTGLSFSGGGVTLSRGELIDLRLDLHETPEGEMNIKQVVNRLINPNREKKNPFRLRITSATIRGMEFCLEGQQHRDPPFGIDFKHMHLSELSASVEDFDLFGPTISVDVKALRARERSGFVLHNLSGKFHLDLGELEFTDANILTAESNIFLPHIRLHGDTWQEYKYFVDRVQIEGSVRHSQLAFNDLAYFSPGLHGKPLVLSDVSLDFAGLVSDFDATVNSLRIDRNSYLAVKGSVKGLPDLRKTHFDLNVSRLSTDPAEVQRIVRTFTGKPLAPKAAELLTRAGRMQLKARFEGTPADFRMNAGADTRVGGLQVDLALRPHAQHLRSIDGSIATHNLQLGQLLGRPDLFGETALSAELDGVIGRDYADAQIDGTVDRFVFNDYAYDTIRFDGRLYNRQFDGRISINDPNLGFDFAGLFDLNDSVPRYDFMLALHRADLAQLHINRRDSVSRLSTRLNARASGRSLDDLNGVVRLSDARYEYDNEQLSVENFTLRGKNSATSKFLELQSDFVDATFRSRTSYSDVFDYLKRSAWRYLPRIDDRGQELEMQELPGPASDYYSQLKVDMRNIEPVIDAITPGWHIAAGTSLNLTFNPANDRLSFRAVSDYIERDNLLAIRLNLNARNDRDSLVVQGDAEDLYAAGLHLPALQLSGGAKAGALELSAGFSDTARRFSGLLGVRAKLSDQAGPHGRAVDVRVLPSHIVRGDVAWRILSRNIRIDTAQVVIDRFLVTSNGQELLLDGVASRREQDSVTLRLSNFDLAPVSHLVDGMGYGIEGRTQGQATMKAVLAGGEIAADIRLDSLTVNDIPAPPMRLRSRWDPGLHRAGIAVTNRIKRDTLIRGYYAPDTRRYYARLQVDSLDLGLLDPILSGVISSTEGLASADLVLRGEGRAADLTGKIDVADLHTTVDFTQVTYSVPAASLDVHGNRFTCAGVPVFDPEGNRGTMDLTLNLQHLSNIAYNVQVRPEQMLVLNTTEADNDLFHGKVYATGNARITGDKGKTDMRITAATAGNSSFFLPMSSKINMSSADFVTFEKPLLVDTTDLLVQKRLQFEQRRKQRSGTTNQLSISMTLDVQPNVELELSVAGNVIRSRGTGVLTMQINPKSNLFEMFGDYTISNGTFTFNLQNIINRKFDIESGSTIQWTGSPVNALLNIDAIYKLKASLQPLLGSTSDRLSSDRSANVECLIHLGDRLTDPDISFDVRVPSSDPEMQAVIANALNTPETVDMQFLYLLLFKSFMDEAGSASQNLGASVSYNTGLQFLTNQLSNLLSADDYSIVIRYRPKTDMLSDEVDFGLSKGLIDNRLFVELEGNYLLDNRHQINRSMSSFMGEAYITYLIDRAGTLKLKAFTQTIDRFDENQGLQETGIGVYFKEDFDNFRDLRRRIKERFTNKTRQERRAAKRAARAAEKQLKEAAARNGQAETEPDSDSDSDPDSERPAEKNTTEPAEPAQQSEPTPNNV